MDNKIENIKNIIDAYKELVEFNGSIMDKSAIDLAKAVAFDHICKIVEDDQ